MNCSCSKKGSPDRGKIWESIHERLNKLDNPKFIKKQKRGIRDQWNLLQTTCKRTQREELRASGSDCELSKKDVLIEELCEKEDSFSAKRVYLLTNEKFYVTDTIISSYLHSLK